MNPETISVWADVAAIFLVVNVVVLTLAVGVGLGFGWWYLRKGRRALSMPLLMGQVYSLRVQHITIKVTDRIANVPIQIHATTAQVTTTVRVLGQSLRARD